jgi:hypothetical protein
MPRAHSGEIFQDGCIDSETPKAFVKGLTLELRAFSFECRPTLDAVRIRNSVRRREFAKSLRHFVEALGGQPLNRFPVILVLHATL